MDKVHDIQERFKEHKISDQENHIKELSVQIKELKGEHDFNQRLKNQDIKKEIKDYKAKIIHLNKIVNDMDEELTHTRQL